MAATSIVRGQKASIRSARDAIDLGIETIHQDTSLAPDLSIARNLFLGREPVKLPFLGVFAPLDFPELRRAASALLRAGRHLQEARRRCAGRHAVGRRAPVDRHLARHAVRREGDHPRRADQQSRRRGDARRAALRQGGARRRPHRALHHPQHPPRLPGRRPHHRHAAGRDRRRAHRRRHRPARRSRASSWASTYRRSSRMRRRTDGEALRTDAFAPRGLGTRRHALAICRRAADDARRRRRARHPHARIPHRQRACASPRWSTGRSTSPTASTRARRSAGIRRPASAIPACTNTKARTALPGRGPSPACC